jgi:hypothetical protein
MRIRYRLLHQILLLCCVLAWPAILFLFIEPDVGPWTHTLQIMANAFVFSLGGLGGLLALLIRAGIVRFEYTDADKNTFGYKLAKSVARRERDSSFGSRFSKRYFQHFDRDRVDETAASTPVEKQIGTVLLKTTRIISIAFIGGGLLFLITGCLLLLQFVHGNNTTLIGAVFVAGSLLDIAVGMFMYRFGSRFIRGRDRPRGGPPQF